MNEFLGQKHHTAERKRNEKTKQNPPFISCMLMEPFCIFQACAVIESVAAARKEEEEDSGPSDPRCDGAPSHSVTLESEKTDRAERPLSSEYGSLRRKPDRTAHCCCVFQVSSCICHLLARSHLPSSLLSACVRACLRVYQWLGPKILPSASFEKNKKQKESLRPVHRRSASESPLHSSVTSDTHKHTPLHRCSVPLSGCVISSSCVAGNEAMVHPLLSFHHM